MRKHTWSEEELEDIRVSFNRGKSDEEIGKIMNVPVSTVGTKRREMGLKRMEQPQHLADSKELAIAARKAVAENTNKRFTTDEISILQEFGTIYKSFGRVVREGAKRLRRKPKSVKSFMIRNESMFQLKQNKMIETDKIVKTETQDNHISKESETTIIKQQLEINSNQPFPYTYNKCIVNINEKDMASEIGNKYINFAFEKARNFGYHVETNLIRKE